MSSIVNEILPLGSLVVLKGATEPLMIIRNERILQNDEAFDYIGISHMYGYIATDVMRYFNREEIENVYFIGYIDQKITKKLKNIQKKYEGEKEYERLS